jgi:nucleotide-binding universal stress UspA family protein
MDSSSGSTRSYEFVAVEEGTAYRGREDVFSYFERWLDSSQNTAAREPGDAAAPLPSVVREAHARAGPDATLVLGGGPAGYVLDRASDHENARLIVIGAGDLQRGTESGESLAVQLSGIGLCPIVVLPNDAPLPALRPADPDRIAIAAARSR